VLVFGYLIVIPVLFYLKDSLSNGDMMIDGPICVVLTTMLLWSYHKATQDPGWLEKRHIETYTEDPAEETAKTCKKCEAFKTS
jgi:hypothetical protein